MADPKLQFSEIQDEDVTEVIALWERCGLLRPWNDPQNDIAFCRQKPNSTILVGRIDKHEAILTSVMLGHDGHRGWVYYLSVDPNCQGKGYGASVMNAAEKWMLSQGVWKLQLMVRRGNEGVTQFYDKLGYQESSCMIMERWIDPAKRGGT
jgi:GNAT superfamily N-acetyltransferase